MRHRTRARALKTTKLHDKNVAGLGVRFNPATFSGYVAVLDNGGLLTVVRSDMGNLEELDVPTLPITADTDVIVEMVALGSQIDTYVWRPGEPRPSTPASSVVDTTYTSGRAAIVYNEDDNNTAGVFRFAAAQDTPFFACDFDGDTRCTLVDLDMLTMEAATGGNGPQFDLNGDGSVDRSDINDPTVGWLTQGGAANPDVTDGNPFLEGDANLDSVVDGQDFIVWNGNKFNSTGLWSLGDFNADGVTDGQDFLLWNGNKFTSSDGVSAVPEPSAGAFFFSLVLLGAVRSRR